MSQPSSSHLVESPSLKNTSQVHSDFGTDRTTPLPSSWDSSPTPTFTPTLPFLVPQKDPCWFPWVHQSSSGCLDRNFVILLLKQHSKFPVCHLCVLPEAEKVMLIKKEIGQEERVYFCSTIPPSNDSFRQH